MYDVVGRMCRVWEGRFGAGVGCMGIGKLKKQGLLPVGCGYGDGVIKFDKERLKLVPSAIYWEMRLNNEERRRKWER
jgi:hypothetical protein